MPFPSLTHELLYAGLYVLVIRPENWIPVFKEFPVRAGRQTLNMQLHFHLESDIKQLSKLVHTDER